MFRISIALGLAAMAALLSGQSTANTTDEVFDTVRGPKIQNRGPEHPPTLNRQSMIDFELPGYRAGEYVHSGTLALCRRVSNEIRARDRHGWRIDRVVVRGYADGLQNPGIPVDLATLPRRCQFDKISFADDVALARLRACLVLDALTAVSPTRYPAGVKWSTDQYDEPDGGPDGPRFRKVKIEVMLTKD